MLEQHRHVSRQTSAFLLLPCCIHLEQDLAAWYPLSHLVDQRCSIDRGPNRDEMGKLTDLVGLQATDEVHVDAGGFDDIFLGQ